MFAISLLVVAVASGNAIPLEDFYPFGSVYGDSNYTQGIYSGCSVSIQCSPPVSLSMPVPFYGNTNLTEIFVSYYSKV